MSEAPYKLVEFAKEIKDGIKSVDIVPSSWIFYDDTTGLMTKFMPQPYNDEKLAYLHSLMQLKVPAPENWPNYTINVRGEASKLLNTFISFYINTLILTLFTLIINNLETYEEALKKVEILKNKKYVFSTDNETTAKTKVSALKKRYKMQGSQKNDNKKLWEVPALEECYVNDKCITYFLIMDIIFV